MDNEKLMKARADALDGVSPRAKGRQKELTALRWVYRWDWTTPQVLDVVCHHLRGGMAKKLMAKGYLREEKTGTGGAKGRPASIVALTQLGRAVTEAEMKSEDEMRDDYHGFRRVRWKQIEHDVLVQRTVARVLDAGHVVAYRTPQEIAERSEPGIKEPDTVLIYRSGKTLALELELTPKSSRKMDEFVYGVVQMLDNKTTPYYDFALIQLTSQAAMRRYKDRLKAGASMPSWKRDQRGRPYKSHTAKVPAWIDRRIIFEKVEL